MKESDDGASLFAYESVLELDMIKTEGEAGNDARLYKDKLLVMLIFTALTTKNGLKSRTLKALS